jgi:hypothetical protein
MKKLAITFCSLLLLAGVAAQTSRPLTDENGWLFSTNDIDERFARIAKHFRGYDNAMLEVGQRFQFVYDALKDENPELAEYHFVKIKLAMENGILKRPKRAANTQAINQKIKPRNGRLLTLQKTLAWLVMRLKKLAS